MAKTTKTYYEVIAAHKVVLLTDDLSEATAKAKELGAFLWKTETDFQLAFHRVTHLKVAAS